MNVIQLPTGTKMRGLHLKDPYGAMIALGKKSHIAKGRAFDLSGPWILVSGGVGYGTINVSPPEAVSEAEFVARFDEHRVAKRSRRKWWGDRRVLYLSEITDFQSFDDRPLIQTFPHMQTVIEEVEFKDGVPECLGDHCGKVEAFIKGLEVPMTEQDEAMLQIDGRIVSALVDTPDEAVEAIELVEGLMSEDPAPAVNVAVSPNALDLLISRIHKSFTQAADDMLAFGYMSEDERISLSGAIGKALGRFNEVVSDVGLGRLRSVPLNDEHALLMASKEGEPEDGEEVPKEGVKPMSYDPRSLPESERSGGDAKAIGEGQGVGGPKQGEGGVDQCLCPECGATSAHERGTPCAEQKCPKCGSAMAGKDPEDAGKKTAGFKTFTAKDGRSWLLTWTTNAYQDREGETFRSKAIEKFVERHAAEDVKGEYWFWHIPGSKFADIHWQAMVGRFLVEAGPFDDTPVGRKMAAFFAEHPDGHPEIAPEGWGTSHGYVYIPSDRKDGVYDWFDKFETTVLPFGVASNQHSPRMEVLRMNKKQEDALAVIGGEEIVEDVIQTADLRAKELDEMGVSWKDAGHLAVQALAKDTPAEEVDEAVEETVEEAVAEGEVEETSVLASKELEEVARQIIAGLGLGELTTAVKENGVTVQTISEKLENMDQRIKGLEDGGVEAHEPLIPMPRGALWRASQAAQTETDDKAADSAPKLPEAISEMAKRMPG